MGVVFLMAGCKQPSITTSTQIEKKPLGAIDAVAANALSSKAKATFQSKFKIQLFTSKSGSTGEPMCDGTIDAQLLSNSQLVFPGSDFKCTMQFLGKPRTFNIPISKLLGAPDEQNLPKDATVAVDGRYIGIKYAIAKPGLLGGSGTHDKATKMKMTPPAPFILGPVISDSSTFAGFNARVPLMVETETGLKSQGAAGVYVKEVGVKYPLPDNSYTFDDVIYWVRVTEGFTDLPGHMKTVAPMLGIKEMHFWSNTKPIAFTRIVIILDIKTLLDLGGGQILASLFVGSQATIKLELLSHREL